jgi:hypothetical protein
METDGNARKPYDLKKPMKTDKTTTITTRVFSNFSLSSCSHFFEKQFIKTT